MYKGKKVSVVFATYREKKSIRKVINSFFKTKFVDEIIVVNNNAEVGTDEQIKKTKAKIIYENRQGYGFAFQTALVKAKGDLVIVCEPDATFTGEDLERFLVYSKKFDVVLGSRTSLIPSLEFRGMGMLRKFANVLEAKSIEILFNTNALTDVGCTYKLFRRKAIQKIKNKWRIQKSALFNTELLLLTVRENLSFVEIPVTYTKRIGKSQIIENWMQEVKWGVIIQVYILFFWLKWLLFKK